MVHRGDAGMRISIIGTGYVGLVTGVVFADKGHSVICVDTDAEKVEMINRGEPPIFERDLEPMLKRVVEGGKLSATTDLDEAVLNSEVSFICVGTPVGSFDYIDLRYIKEASKSLGKALRGKDSYHVVVVKSTVVPGTTEHVVIPILEEYSGKKAGEDFGVVMVPEFLREGNAVYDSLNPDRVIIGGLDERSMNIVKELYRDYEDRFFITNPRTAEMIKYATNSFLVTKISFINEIGNICKLLGIDVYDVAKALGMDRRISPHFLNAGIGFGGSCFPKDVKALIGKAGEVYYYPIILNAALEVNERQALRVVELLEKMVDSLDGKDVVVLGLAFKPGTDDIREAPSIRIIQTLLNKGARVHATDPKAVKNAKKVLGQHENLKFYEDAREAVKQGEYVLIVTEWDEYRDEELYRDKVVIDGRRVEEAKKKSKHYEGVCW
jgi:UDPglucose 6-dehydrogenase